MRQGIEELERTRKTYQEEATNSQKKLGKVETDLASTKKLLDIAQSDLVHAQTQVGKLKDAAERCQSLGKELEEKNIELASAHSLLDVEKQKVQEMSDANAELLQEGIDNYVAEAGFQNLYGDGYATGFTSCQKWLRKKNIPLPPHIFDDFDEELVADVSLTADVPDDIPLPNPVETDDSGRTFKAEGSRDESAPDLNPVPADPVPTSTQVGSQGLPVPAESSIPEEPQSTIGQSGDLENADAGDP